jgi:hypothetical protein
MSDKAPPRPPEGLEEWLALVDHVLQGVHHALNNRIGSISAAVELLQMGDAAAVAGVDGAKALESDVARLIECNRVLRLLPYDRHSGEEPLIIDDVLADVLAIHRFIHEVRDLPVTIVPVRYVEPVRCERSALLQVLTLLLAEVKRLVKDSTSVVRAVTESDEQWVCVRFQAGAPLLAEAPTSASGYAESLAATFGGTVTRKSGAAELRLPTLKARRGADRQSP